MDCKKYVISEKIDILGDLMKKGFFRRWRNRLTLQYKNLLSSPLMPIQIDAANLILIIMSFVSKSIDDSCLDEWLWMVVGVEVEVSLFGIKLAIAQLIASSQVYSCNSLRNRYVKADDSITYHRIIRASSIHQSSLLTVRTYKHISMTTHSLSHNWLLYLSYQLVELRNFRTELMDRLSIKWIQCNLI